MKTQDGPTQRQISYLRSLGVKEQPNSKQEASRLITEALKTAPVRQDQIDYLKSLGHSETITTYSKAQAIIRSIEGHAHEVLCAAFPLLAETDIVPNSVMRKMTTALRSSPLWPDIKAGKPVPQKSLRTILEPALGEATFKLINKRSDDAALALEERFESAWAYLAEYLEDHGKQLSDDQLQALLFTAWVEGLGPKLASTYQKWEDSLDGPASDRYQKDTKLNEALHTFLKQNGIQSGSGCLLAILTLGAGLLGLTIMGIRTISTIPQ